MDVTYYRNRIINIAKNLKNNGTAINDSTIAKIEQLINYTYNLSSNVSSLFAQKFELVIQKYSLTVRNINNSKVIVFPIIQPSDNKFILYKMLSDFMYKIDFFINLSNDKLNNFKDLFSKINKQHFDYISVIPIITQSSNYIKNFDDNIEIMKTVIINDQQFSSIENIECTNDKSLQDIRANSITGSHKWDLQESNVKSLID